MPDGRGFQTYEEFCNEQQASRAMADHFCVLCNTRHMPGECLSAPSQLPRVPDTRLRGKFERIERLRTRLEQVKLEHGELRPLVGVLNGMLDLLADEL